jgi:hypothetical protein
MYEIHPLSPVHFYGIGNVWEEKKKKTALSIIRDHLYKLLGDGAL